MDPKIVNAYDIVFFDQRGVGLSEPLACPEAAARFYLSPADARDPRQEEAVLAASRTFAVTCVRESGARTADLPFFATRQAVEDLEAFRRYLGVDRLDLYGESYGTQYVQTYALAHPDRVRSLILDGPVDLTLPLTEAWPEAVRAMDRTLDRTLRACDADPACRRDTLGGDALAAYDAFAARLARSPARVAFPLASGRTVGRRLWATHLETVALNGMYGQWGRMELQRVVAAASRGDLVPAERVLYADVGVDPETLAASPDPSWSDAAYYAIEYTDYAMAGDTPDARARAYLPAMPASAAARPAGRGRGWAGSCSTTCPAPTGRHGPRPTPVRSRSWRTTIHSSSSSPTRTRSHRSRAPSGSSPVRRGRDSSCRRAARTSCTGGTWPAWTAW